MNANDRIINCNSFDWSSIELPNHLCFNLNSISKDIEFHRHCINQNIPNESIVIFKERIPNEIKSLYKYLKPNDKNLKKIEDDFEFNFLIKKINDCFTYNKFLYHAKEGLWYLIYFEDFVSDSGLFCIRCEAYPFDRNKFHELLDNLMY